MDIRKTSKYSGSVGLLTVLIMSTILVVSGITVVLLALDLQRGSAGMKYKIEARILSKTCFEEALNIIKDDLAYTGVYSYTQGSNTCTATVTNISPGMLSVITEATYNGYTYGESHTIDATTYPISVAN